VARAGVLPFWQGGCLHDQSSPAACTLMSPLAIRIWRGMQAYSGMACMHACMLFSAHDHQGFSSILQDRL
jgi:hypothetical protein